MSPKLSIGYYTANPFSLEGLNIKVYCVEELCYALKENAFLLDMDCMSDRLVRWISQECGLTDLAQSLHDLIHKKGSLSIFVCSILEYTGFYSVETIRSVSQTLKKGVGLNVLQKRKMRIDHLVEQKKYRAAINEYDVLLSAWEDAKERGEAVSSALQAGMLHNKATALAGLMLYEDAARTYMKAYEADGNEESLVCYLAAKRMQFSEKEYVDFIAGQPECYEISLELERKVEQLNSWWEQEADYIRLTHRHELRDTDERSYLEENANLMQALKDGYRHMV